jgi:hypothetical protein
MLNRTGSLASAIRLYVAEFYRSFAGAPMTCCKRCAFVERIDRILHHVLTGGTVSIAGYAVMAMPIRQP